jgi:hypothetical protein
VDTAENAIRSIALGRKNYLFAGSARGVERAAIFYKLDDWMSEFYAVPRIGLEDNPQLLESLGKVVK